MQPHKCKNISLLRFPLAHLEESMQKYKYVLQQKSGWGEMETGEKKGRSCYYAALKQLHNFF